MAASWWSTMALRCRCGSSSSCTRGTGLQILNLTMLAPDIDEAILMRPVVTAGRHN